METANEYFARTESAVQTLFTGIKGYMKLIRKPLVYVGSDPAPDGPAFLAWQDLNREQIQEMFAKHREFFAETFALSTLCGAVLQVAAKAIEVYSASTIIPERVSDYVKATSKSALPFCIGRTIKDVPLGLIVLAGRNQHTHYNETKLNAVNQGVFRQISLFEVTDIGHELRDPAFDLRNPKLVSFAANITALLGWRSYDQYIVDMRALPLTDGLDTEDPAPVVAAPPSDAPQSDPA
ncbi:MULTISPECIES: hypothetical protein [Cupriavidus]